MGVYIYAWRKSASDILLIIYPYTSSALPSHQYIYWTCVQVVDKGFCSSVVEHCSSNPEDAGFDSQPQGLGVAFFANWSRFGSYHVYLNDTQIPKHNFEFHLLTTSVNAKYYYWYTHLNYVLVWQHIYTS